MFFLFLEVSRVFYGLFDPRYARVKTIKKTSKTIEIKIPGSKTLSPASLLITVSEIVIFFLKGDKDAECSET